jgi:HNH endonuclease
MENDDREDYAGEREMDAFMSLLPPSIEWELPMADNEPDPSHLERHLLQVARSQKGVTVDTEYHDALDRQYAESEHEDREAVLETIRAAANELGRTPTGEEWMKRWGGNRTLMMRVFGNWGNAVEAAGLERPKSGPRPGETEKPARKKPGPKPKKRKSKAAGVLAPLVDDRPADESLLALSVHLAELAEEIERLQIRYAETLGQIRELVGS